MHAPIVHLRTPPMIDRFVREVFALLPPELRSLAMLGGGAIRHLYDGTPLKDYDLFFRTEADWLEATQLLNLDERFIIMSDSAAAVRHPTYIRLGHPYGFNLIGFGFTADTAALARSFDLTCCGFAACIGADDHVFFSSVDTAIEDAMAKALRINQRDTLERTQKRIAHYRDDYGYTLSSELANDLVLGVEDATRVWPTTSPRGGS